ncbi:hypothetical protein VFPFJ_09463 [Purpureocillium lilacinum]|uniref:Uncharacterized protein n=1 Tax=Purpureocillium lilacinum TaxID=33203 RepID=A0A179GE26_PURLI|nr:hypothetical protein VFPFJ_09463 [Purpureocillium lilacinum]OAQ75379.1 hypothetical protein VFPBJ_09352 [Purpureocillium lilacinum]OAQ81008.1 hypothetical protein VFPFJ_09463 [Purpureocillium lilacinum]
MIRPLSGRRAEQVGCPASRSTLSFSHMTPPAQLCLDSKGASTPKKRQETKVSRPF